MYAEVFIHSLMVEETSIFGMMPTFTTQ